MIREGTNKIIRSLWIGDRLSNLERLCVQSFLENGHEFHLYVYSKVDNVPSGAELRDANDIIPFASIFQDSFGTYASFSDWFRYQMLYDEGGWWVDMDVICLKYFDFSSEYCFATERLVGNGEILISNAVMKVERGAEFLKEILDHIEHVLGNVNNASICWGEFGPFAIDKVLSSYQCQQYIQKPECFCPVNWDNVEELVKESRNVDISNSYSVHLWNRLWGVKGFEKDLCYSEFSIFETLKRKYQRI